MRTDLSRSWLCFFLGFLGLVSASGCGSGAPLDKPHDASGTGCSKDALAACEALLSSAIEHEENTTDLLHTYARARRAEDDTDEVERSIEGMKKLGVKAVLVRIGEAKAAKPGVAHVDLRARPKLEKISLGALFLAIGNAIKADLIIVSEADGTVTRIYPGDPLTPLQGGLLPVTVSHDAFDLDSEAMLESELHLADSSASDFDYVSAADAIDKVDTYTDKGGAEFSAPTMRGIVFSSALGMSKPASLTAGEGKPPMPAPPAMQADETPYYDLLRIRLDNKSHEWPLRSARLLAAVPEEERAAMTALFDPRPSCVGAVPPLMIKEKDLIFVGLLPRLLRPAYTRSALGRLKIEDWYPYYSSAVSTAQRTKKAWLVTDWLIYERGQASGIVPTGLEAHRTMTSLALRHARALKKLATERPGRVELSRASFLSSASNALDPELKKEILDLTSVEAASSLSLSKSAADVLFATFISVLVAGELPGDVRDAHVDALQGAFTARLRGEFETQTGWSVAAMYALDGAYRELRSQAPNLGRTSDEVIRALDDRSIAEPAVAALVSAITRYVSLAAKGDLGPELPKGADLRPERAKALSALAHALAGIGGSSGRAPGPPDSLAQDVAELADGTIATIAIALSPSKAALEAPRAAGCAVSAKDPPLGPSAKSALARLRDVRRRVFADASFKEPKTELARRLKLIATLLSDAIDVAESRGQENTAFAIKDADAEAAIRPVLGGWVSEPGVGDTLVSTYLLARGDLGQGVDYFKGSIAARNIQGVLAGLGEFFRDDDGSFQGATMLSKLVPAKTGTADLAASLVTVAKVLYLENKREEADILLLGSMVVSALHEQAPSDDALSTARSEKSEVAWLLTYEAQIQGSKNRRIDTSTFIPEVEKVMAEHCGSPDIRGVEQVINAISDFDEGKRKEGRDNLRAFIDHSLADGFAMPHFSFAFQQETRTKVFAITLDFGFGHALLSSNNTVNVSAGAKSSGEPVLRLTKTATSPENKASVNDGAKYVIDSAALLAAWDFLDGDPEQGDMDAARAIGLLTQRSSLGVPGVTTDGIEWVKDARGSLALLAELAADAGRPLLAGDLLSLVKNSFDPAQTNEATIDGALDTATEMFKGDKAAAAYLVRAKQTLKRLSRTLPCIQAKPESQGFEKVSCEDYPKALALRVADSLPILPTLEAGPKGRGGVCPDYAALDSFLQGQQSKVYDPDKFTVAVDALMASHKYYDATVLMARQRRPDHCSQAITDRLQTLIDKTKSGIEIRSDLLASLTNCQTGAPPAVVMKNVTALDDELQTIGDPQRDFALLLATAQYSVQKNAWEPLETIAMKPGFLEKWERVSPDVAGPTLLFDHVASTMKGQQVRIDETKKEFELLCGGVPPTERVLLCKTLEGLRKKGPPDDARKQIAFDAMKTVGPPTTHP